jgi:ribonuclease P protein component
MPTARYPVGFRCFWAAHSSPPEESDGMTAPLARITKRPEYLAVAGTRRKWVTPAFILQARPGDGESAPRAGFTVSKKVGKAVVRSRARRRLKEATRAVLPEKGQPGWDYVLVGRIAATDYPFEKLKADLKWALAKLHAGADLRATNQRDSRAGNGRPKGKANAGQHKAT